MRLVCRGYIRLSELIPRAVKFSPTTGLPSQDTILVRFIGHQSLSQYFFERIIAEASGRLSMQFAQPRYRSVQTLAIFAERRYFP
jgi:hypothetical protein